MTQPEASSEERRQFLDVADEVQAVIDAAERAFERGEDVGYRLERSKIVDYEGRSIKITQQAHISQTIGSELVQGEAGRATKDQALSNEWLDARMIEGGDDLCVVFCQIAGEENDSNHMVLVASLTQPEGCYDPRDDRWYRPEDDDFNERRQSAIDWVSAQLATDTEITSILFYGKLADEDSLSVDETRLSDIARIELWRRSSTIPNDQPDKFYVATLRHKTEDNKDETLHIGIIPATGEVYLTLPSDDDEANHEDGVVIPRSVPSKELLKGVVSLIENPEPAVISQ